MLKNTAYIVSLFADTVYRLFADGYIIGRNADAKSVAKFGIVFLGDIGSILNLHGRDILALKKDLSCHLTGSISEIIVADGKSCNSATGADSLFTRNNRNTCGNYDVSDSLGRVCKSVIGGDIKNLTLGNCG